MIPLERLKKALEELGGYIWFYIELKPFRTVYTLALCGGVPCVVISGQDMMPVQLSLDEYLQIENNEKRLKSLKYTIQYLLRQKQ